MKLLGVLRCLCVAWLLVVASGCAIMSKRPVYRLSYQPYTTEIFPPKPANYEVPILCGRPERKFEFIGRFTFGGGYFHSDKRGSNEKGMPLESELISAARAKARRVGADAIVIFENSVRSEAFTREIRRYDPPTPNIPDKKDKGKGDSKREASRNTDKGSSFDSGQGPSTPSYSSEMDPGRNVSRIFDVEMIVYRGPEKMPVSSVSGGNDNADHWRSLMRIPRDTALKRP